MLTPEELEQVTAFIRDASASGLWGEVILSFKHGALVGARKTQTFLAEDVLRPKRGRSTQEGH